MPRLAKRPRDSSGKLLPVPLADRFWSKVDVRAPDECWPWTGRDITNGYGVLRDGAGRRRPATQIALELAGRPKPRTVAYACHSCDNPPCVNPHHLWWGSSSENMLDSVAKGRHPQATKTHCPQGHEYTPKNTYVSRKGGRCCRRCNADKTWARNHALQREAT